MQDDQSEEMPDLTCHEHGQQPGTIVCRHLLTEKNRGFHPAGDETEDPLCGGWCAECESIYLQEGESCTEAFLAQADFGSICQICYQEAKRRNRLRLIQ
jgi:hypothetical protein